MSVATANQTAPATGARNSAPAPAFDVQAMRGQFPALQQVVHGRPLVYLDNAATTQKPRAVLDATHRAYTEQCANIHRGVHLLSARATEAFEAVREDARAFLRAPSPEEIIFTRGTTESINLVAHSYARQRLRTGDEIVISGLEHHSNIVPWQMACLATGATLQIARLDEHGDVPLAEFERVIGPRTRIVAISHISNALGTLLPVREVVQLAHAQGAVVLVDGAQSAPHGPMDVQALGCDFYAFSAHKIYGPTGSGVLWGKRELLDAMPPYQGGGDMIETVTFERTSYAPVPSKFEAGTPDIAGVIGMGAALRFMNALDWPAVRAHEAALLAHGSALLESIPGVRRIGTAPKRFGVISFVMNDIHPHDIGTVLDTHGVAVRTGHHCAQPVMEHFQVPATTRASVGVYNTLAEMDVLAQAVADVQRMFAGAHSVAVGGPLNRGHDDA